SRGVRTGLSDVAMVSGRYTLREQPAAGQLLPARREHGVHAGAVSAFYPGLLSRPEGGEDDRYEHAQAPAELPATARDLARLAADHGVQRPDLAVQYPLRRPAITSVVLGMRTCQQVRQNITRMQRQVPEELWEQVDG